MTKEKTAGIGVGGPLADPCADPSEPDRCRGVWKSGKRCKLPARCPAEAPVWCANCDPAQAERRAAAGRIRHKRFSRMPQLSLGESRSLPPNGAVPTIDYIVDLCLDAALKVEQGDIEPPAGQAIKGLLGKALDAMKAHGLHGDARRATDPAPDKPDEPPPVDPMVALQTALDS